MPIPDAAPLNARRMSAIIGSFVALAGCAGAQRESAVGPARQAAESGLTQPAVGAQVETDPRSPNGDAADPRLALQSLDRVGAYLRSLRAFSVRAETTIEEVLETGQKLQFERTVLLWAKAPNRLRADVTSDAGDRQFFYDGRTFTVYGRRTGFYASVPAPPMLSELIDSVRERYALELPLVDLFYWGTAPMDEAAFRSAVLVGPSTIQGVLCDHYAFSQEELDWQIWLVRGSHPLPRKLVITTTVDTAQPQFTALLSWNVRPELKEEHFHFAPPRGASRIVLEEVTR